MKYPVLSINIILSLIKMLTSYQIKENAQNIGFTKRNNGLTALTFFQAFTIGLWNVHEVTLDIISGKCMELQYGLKLSKQALFNRLKLGAPLMKELLNLAIGFSLMNSYRTETIEVLKQFKNVYICDSTTISLPNKLENIFKGLGGKNANAAVKIQAVFNIMSKKFEKFELSSATVNDNKYTDKVVKSLEPAELIIYDLGYFCIKSFEEIIAKRSYFISRIKTNTLFYIDSVKEACQFEKINLLNILNKSSDGLVDTWIYIGKNKICVRLVAVRLPEEKVNERRRKENKKAVTKGEALTDYELELLAWNIMITDVPEDMLSAKTICELYRIRWQIELIFKSWKGCFGVDEMNNVGENYFNCIMYGRLIIITLMTTLFSRLNYYVFASTGRLLSMARFFKNLREKLDLIINNLKYNTRNAREITHFIGDVINRSLEEKRRRKTTERTLMEHDFPDVVLQIVA